MINHHIEKVKLEWITINIQTQNKKRKLLSNQLHANTIIQGRMKRISSSVRACSSSLCLFLSLLTPEHKLKVLNKKIKEETYKF